MDYDWDQLIARGETRSVDFKGPLEFADPHRVELTKDIAAMANTPDGGLILVGVSEDRTAGLNRIDGLTAGQLNSFDLTRVGGFVSSRLQPPVALNIQKPVVQGKPLVAIVVTEFPDVPHIFTQQGLSGGGSLVFRPGELWIRSHAGESRLVDATTMRELLGRAVQRRGDHLLEEMRHIVSGSPPSITTPTTPPFAEALANWEGEESRFRSPLPQELGTLSYRITPVGQSLPDARDHAALKRIVQESSIDLRGRTFPSELGEVVNTENGIRSEFRAGDYAHAWRLFDRLLFGRIQVLDEDSRDGFRDKHPDEPFLYFLNATITVGEHVLFAKRLMNAAAYQGDVQLWIRFGSCYKRRLISLNPMRPLMGDYVCHDTQVVLDRTVHTTDLDADWIGIATGMVLRLFALFNFDRDQPQMEQIIRQDLERYRDRRLLSG